MLNNYYKYNIVGSVNSNVTHSVHDIVRDIVVSGNFYAIIKAVSGALPMVCPVRIRRKGEGKMKKSILFGLAAVLSLTFVPLVGVSAAEDEYRISEAALKLADDEDDFYEDDSSDVYEEDLPVPEIETLENGSRSVNISWICDDTGSIEGFYLERTKDGTNWNRIETINDPDVLDYEDTDIEAGDLCGYRLYAFTAGQVGEASVPEYTCFLKKIELRAVKSNASKKVQVKWADTINSVVSGYELQISSTKTFSKTTTEPPPVAFRDSCAWVAAQRPDIPPPTRTTSASINFIVKSSYCFSR